MVHSCNISVRIDLAASNAHNGWAPDWGYLEGIWEPLEMAATDYSEKTRAQVSDRREIQQEED